MATPPIRLCPESNDIASPTDRVTSAVEYVARMQHMRELQGNQPVNEAKGLWHLTGPEKSALRLVRR